jgi:hypothetical protein
MSKLFVGIDFSFNSCGVTFMNGTTMEHMCIFNKYTIKKTEMTDEEAHEESVVLKLIDDMQCLNILTNRVSVPQVKDIGLLAWERIHMAQTILFSNLVYNSIATFIQLKYKHVNPKNIFIGIENYSYTRNTNNIIEMCEFTAPVKQQLLSNVLGLENLENFYVVTAPTVKKFAGKGDFDKYDMFKAFLNEPINSQFHKTLLNNEKSFYIVRTKKGKLFNDMIAPVPDIIDSYFIAKWMKNEIINV